MAIPIMITIRSVVPDGSQVTILSFPPLRCENKGENYFSKIFSAGTTITPSITLLSIIVWLIHKVHAGPHAIVFALNKSA